MSPLFLVRARVLASSSHAGARPGRYYARWYEELIVGLCCLSLWKPFGLADSTSIDYRAYGIVWRITAACVTFECLVTTSIQE